MGANNSKPKEDYSIAEFADRKFWVKYKSHKSVYSRLYGTFIVFTFTIRYQKYVWDIEVRYNEVVDLNKKLVQQFPDVMNNVIKPEKFNKMFWTHDPTFLSERSKMLTKYLQTVLDRHVLFESSKQLKTILNVSINSFNPDDGRKGREGWLLKCSGGYVEKFSNRTGDFLNIWTWRWVVLHDTCIAWYKTPEATEMQGSVIIDQDFHFTTVGRLITVYTKSRKLPLQATTTRQCSEWTQELIRMYNKVPRTSPQPYGSSYPPRMECQAKVYTYSKNYMSAVAVALLSAQKEILITSWKNSPGVLLTRPPHPPLRLDQILKLKADQGVQIRILLYKEVEYVGQGNDSGKSMAYLESLSPNIKCIRHPNKFIGGSTAILWSHHEKLVVIDRNLAFVGGIDLAYQRWDDEQHRVADEDGIIYPGGDYRQPATGLFKPAKEAAVVLKQSVDATDFEGGNGTEVEVHQAGESLPFAAASAVMDDADDTPVEIQVESVVDFGIQSDPRSSEQQQHYKVGGKASRSAAVAVTMIPTEANMTYTAACTNPVDPRRAPPGVDDDNRSEISVNWAEDAKTPDTAEEAQAKMAGASEGYGGGDNASSTPVDDMDEMDRATMAACEEAPADNKPTMKDDLKAGMSRVADGFKGMKAKFNEKRVSSPKTMVQPIETREAYPRMPWHDLHCAVSGSAARDVSAHFIQRWNHHRISTGQLEYPLMKEITDNIMPGECARCETKNISDSAQICPNCGLDLGEILSFCRPPTADRLPEFLDTFSYIIFECTYEGQLPFRMMGDCPVVVTAILLSAQREEGFSEGRLIDVNGEKSEWLHAFGLVPAVGDVVLAVDNSIVTHLNSNQLKRYLKRKRANSSWSSPSHKPVTTFTFRRHFLDNMAPTDKKLETSTEETAITGAVLAESAFEAGNPKLASGAGTFPDSAATNEALRRRFMTDDDPSTGGGGSPSAAIIIARPASAASASGDLVGQVAVAVAESAECRSQLLSKDGARLDEEDERMDDLVLPAVPLNEFAVQPITPGNRNAQANANSVELYHPACKAAAHEEVKLAMSQLYHHHSTYLDIIDVAGAAHGGSLKVQVLRSVGKWSIGTKPENSIARCWIESIHQALKFIYIESQFFIGNTAGEGVSNGIPGAIVERIAKAFHEKQPFRVIIMVPIHPNGDFAAAMKSKIVLHFQCLTINKGASSMFAQLRARCPGIVVEDYIGFFSLRAWGVINNKVVSDQVYIHDKLLIVDDRVAVIGSANVNDRSMLGGRDSEVAVRIEDTLHVDITMGGLRHTVGLLPHTLRTQLMRQHLGDQIQDVSDILDASVFNEIWLDRSMRNSVVYDELDGDISVYRCKTLNEYRTAFEKHVNKSILDPQVRNSLAEIKGFLVNWPYDLFKDEDLKPTLATRAIVPNDLWV